LAFGCSHMKMILIVSLAVVCLVTVNSVSPHSLEDGVAYNKGSASSLRNNLGSLLLAVGNSGGARVRSRTSPVMVSKETGEFRKKNMMTVENEGSKEYEPMPTFESTPFAPSIKDVWKRLGYDAPSAIQAQSFPVALDGRDIISIARTGSGKTVAFLMPAVHKFMQDKKKAQKAKKKDVEYGRVDMTPEWTEFARKGGSQFKTFLASEAGAEEVRIQQGEVVIEADPEELDEAVKVVENILSKPPGSATAQVFEDKIGMVIGPKGSNINGIKEKTGCNIDITDTVSFSGYVDVIITGPPQMLDTAVSLVQDTRRGRVNVRQKAAPRALVLGPTRELVQQIEEEAKKYTQATGIKACAVYGGTNKGAQQRDLTEMPEVLAATPGRCNDLAQTGALDLSKVEYLVLDEADRMLDMGFEPQIKEILQYIPKDRQTLFFSATWPKEVRFLADKYLKNPVQVTIGGSDELNANKNIKQHVVMTDKWSKEQEFMKLLQDLNPDEGNDPLRLPKLLIFKNTKVSADDLADKLWNSGYECEALHGDVPQDARTRIMKDYKAGRLNVLVATDVAARGLDVKDVKVVINLDLPTNIEDYVHRIGRTARGDNKGASYAYFTDENANIAQDLVKVLERAGQEVPPELANMRSSSGGGQKRRYR